MELSDASKFIIGGLAGLATLLIPKFWDWWREGAKNRYERLKVLKSSLFLLFKTYGILSECEFFLATKTVRATYGIYLGIGKSKYSDEHKEVILRNVMEHYQELMKSVAGEFAAVIKEMALYEPVLALRLAADLQVKGTNAGLTHAGGPIFESGNALVEVRKTMDRVEHLANWVATAIGREESRQAKNLFETDKKQTIDAKAIFMKEKSAEKMDGD